MNQSWPRFLALRELGACSADLVKNVEHVRMQSMQLSTSKKLERSHKFTGSSFSMDVEQQNQRYMLCGSTDGSVCIFDLDRPVAEEIGVVKHPDEPKRRRYGMISVAKRAKDASRSSKLSHHSSLVVRISWYPHDTGMFASSSTDCRLLLWDTNRMKPVETYQLVEGWTAQGTSRGARPLNCHDWAPLTGSSPRLAVAGELPEVILVDLRSGSSLYRLRSSSSRGIANSVRWSPVREHILCVGTAHGAIDLWDVRHSRKPLVQVAPPHSGSLGVACVRWSPDGLRVLAMLSDTNIRTWIVHKNVAEEVTTPAIQLRPSVGMTLPIKLSQFDVHFAAGGKFCDTALFVPSYDDVHVLRGDGSPNGGSISVLSGHFRWVNACAYRSWHQELYTSGSDKQILCWLPKMDDDAYLQSLGSSLAEATRNLECDEWSD